MVIRNGLVYGEDLHFHEADVVTDGSRIREVRACPEEGGRGEASGSREAAGIAGEVYDASGCYVLPGLVDIHFHGAAGKDFCLCDAEGLREIAEYEAASGITAICPATMTYPEETLADVMDKAAAFRAGGQEKPEAYESCAEMVGINLEGPFLSREKAGAQNPKYLALPDADMIRRLDERSGGLIRVIALAPELDGAMAFIDTLHDRYHISVAHTGADYATATEAFRRGADHMTHLYNAMPPLHHRAPGPIAAGAEQGAEAELIADGVHVDPAMVRLAFRLFGEEKIILISDSMEACGLPDGQYQLGGQDVTVRGNRAVLTEHPETVAGSVTNLYKCMCCAVREMGIPLESAVRAASTNPAVSIGIADRYGCVAPGRTASLVIADRDLTIRDVILRGKILPGR